MHICVCMYIYINTYLHTYIYIYTKCIHQSHPLDSQFAPDHETSAEGTEDPARQQPLVWFELIVVKEMDFVESRPFPPFSLPFFWMFKFFFFLKPLILTSVDHMTNKSEKLEIPPFSYCMIHTMLWINCHLNCEKLM